MTRQERLDAGNRVVAAIATLEAVHDDDWPLMTLAVYERFASAAGKATRLCNAARQTKHYKIDEWREARRW
ncbi:MAG: hypothetical protein PHR35_21725 [Kiritimatiellae bacterium]|nr:hypothetical protein [Kiritimatiellia bacterium]